MACPFFMPVEKFVEGSWPHPSRLPLGAGWTGHCTAPGNEGVVPTKQDLQKFCNMGYADGCVRLPHQRAWDSVRFAARTTSGGQNRDVVTVQLRYICERRHLPAEHGSLEFDLAQTLWNRKHSDTRLQRMAECFLSSYLEGRETRNKEKSKSKSKSEDNNISDEFKQIAAS